MQIVYVIVIKDKLIRISFLSGYFYVNE